LGADYADYADKFIPSKYSTWTWTHDDLGHPLHPRHQRWFFRVFQAKAAGGGRGPTDPVKGKLYPIDPDRIDQCLLVLISGFFL